MIIPPYPRSLTASALTLWTLVQAFPLCSQSRDTLSSSQLAAREIFKEVIEINTTVNVGCTRASEAMAARLKSAGFTAEDILLLGPTPKNRNLVVRFRGKSKTVKPILLIAHLDVVEALRSDWSFDPFKFLEQDGFFYGRGTLDMKCEVADIVANFVRLKHEGYVPNRDLILALTDDEETGDFNGIEWLLAKQRSLIEAEFCINLEGGGGEMRKGKHMLMEIQTSEKVFLSFQLEVKNPGGHSSRPVKENAIYRLAAGLLRLSRLEFPVMLNETTRSFFARMAQQDTGARRRDLLGLLATPLDTAAAARLSDSSPYYNAQMRTTMVTTMLSAGHAENALPQTARAVVNCRMLPGETYENVLSSLKNALADTQIVITHMNEPYTAPSSAVRKDLFGIVQRLTSSMWPGVEVVPVMSTGASDGKYLRHEGIPVYGVSGMFADVDDSREHGRDERIGVKEFYDGAEFMYRFLKSLDALP